MKTRYIKLFFFVYFLQNRKKMGDKMIRPSYNVKAKPIKFVFICTPFVKRVKDVQIIYDVSWNTKLVFFF